MFALYFIGLALYGFWSMFTYIHWSIPILLVSAAIAVPAWSVSVVLAAAAGMAVYGLSIQLELPWYLAVSATITPLVVLILASSAVHYLCRRKI